jgi:hypothetical protein
MKGSEHTNTQTDAETSEFGDPKLLGVAEVDTHRHRHTCVFAFLQSTFFCFLLSCLEKRNEQKEREEKHTKRACVRWEACNTLCGESTLCGDV